MTRLLTILLVFITFTANCGVIVLDGIYQGKNLVVQNPYGQGKVGFCVTKVTVNGDVTTDEVNSSSFEIDLENFKLLVGDKVEVKIFHKDGCKPKIHNPQVLKPRSTFEVVQINIGDDQVLSWKTKNEIGKLSYIVEQYRWNKWVKVGEVEGVGTSGVNSYRFKVESHSGENKYRVSQVDYTNEKRSSKEVLFVSDIEEITFYPKKVKTDIVFSKETLFEIYDIYGNLVKKGNANRVDCSALKKGFYYLNYDNKIGTFNKK